ncbi:excisionase family DNA-binding protein [Pseudodesulfovibrio sp. JC047]|nr:excisionase family DNA-binding protein [Pseudodesulfovibrio sp. JC047]
MKKQTEKTPKAREKDYPEFYTLREVAEILCVHLSTVERMVRDERISSTRPVHKRLIPKSEVHGLINGNWTPATPPE